MELKFSSQGVEMNLQQTLLFAGDSKNVSNRDLATFIYTNFYTILDDLQTIDYPTEESDPNNLISCLAHYCYKMSFVDMFSFENLRILAYEYWYKAMLKAEKGNKQRTLHKGMPLHQLGIFHLQRNNHALAKKYFLLAHIEDTQERLIKNRVSHKGQAYRMLKMKFAVSEAEFATLLDITKEFINSKYPEEVLSRYLSSNKEYRNTTVNEETLVLNKEYAFEVYQKAKETEKNKEKGDIFTRFASYLISTVGGFEVVGENLITKPNQHDYDILVRNQVTSDRILESLGAYFLVECKFLKSKKIGIDVLTKLLYKIKYHDCITGVVFTKTGVATSKEYNLTIKKIFNRDGVIIIAIEDAEINSVLEGKETLVSVFQRAYERVKFEI